MEKNSKIYIAGRHRGLFVSALMRNLWVQGRCVAVDPRYFRPTEVETLLGDATKAKTKLGWTPQTSFTDLVAEMVREDLKSAERDELVKKHGFAAYDYNE